MPTTDFSFTSVLTYNGSNYGDMTLEAQKPGGTSFGAFVETSHFLYLGHDSKFDMAVFDIDTAGSLGTLKYEYYNGSAWTEFNPSSALYATDPDDNEDAQYAFDKDGAELFPENRLDNWATVAIDSKTKYWVRISSPTSVSTAPTFKRIQMRPLAAYCTSQDVFNLMQLSSVLGGTDFTTSTTPTKATIEKFINEAQSYIDYKTRKSWRPNLVFNEFHDFNLSGFKLDRPDPVKILDLKTQFRKDPKSTFENMRKDVAINFKTTKNMSEYKEDMKRIDQLEDVFGVRLDIFEGDVNKALGKELKEK